MKSLTWFGLAVVWVLPASEAPAQAQARKQQPVGLVLGAGMTVARNKAPAAAVRPGEVLFEGDVVKAGGDPVQFLFCPEKFSAALPANAEATLTASSVELKGAALQGRKAAGACFLPPVQKLSVASQQHYGVLMARASDVQAPKNSLEDRVRGLPEARRAELMRDLPPVNEALKAAPGEASLLVARASVYENAGLMYDAFEDYKKAYETWKDAIWLRRKITEIENALLQAQLKKD